MSFFHKPESYLGIDIGAHGIKVVELRQTKGRPQLWTFGIADASLPVHTNALVAPATAGQGRSLEGPERAEPPPTFDEHTTKQYVTLLEELLAKAKVVRSGSA